MPMKALYAGSFDPPHLGHLDLIARAAVQCESLVVGIARNPAKQSFLPEAVRINLLTKLVAPHANVSVVAYDGATVSFAKSAGCTVLVRGLRGAADLAHEYGMAEINRSYGFDTLFLLSAAAHQHLSSSLIRQVVVAGLSLDGLVDPLVAQALSSTSGA